jgi:hypothetical protein
MYENTRASCSCLDIPVKHSLSLFIYYIQFVCEFALENAINAVLELQKCKHFLGEDPHPPFLPKFSMTSQINRKKLYYNYYISGKFLTLKFKFQVKSFDIAPPPHPLHQTSDALLRPRWLYFETDFSFKISLVCSSKWIHEITYRLLLIFWR